MHALAGSPPQRGSMADALDCVAAHGVDGRTVAAWFTDALVSPVLTAHPTEVQRKSILDCEREIARLLQWRDRVELTPDEAAEFDAGLYRQVLALWQTAMIRLSKLKVEDEIENGLAYYRYTFLAEVPKFYLALAARLQAQFGVGSDFVLPPFLRRARGSAATATAIRWSTARRSPTRSMRRPRSRSRTISRKSTGSAASSPFPRAWSRPPPTCCDWRRSAHDENPHRGDEPYRQALIGIYARVAATAGALAGYVPPRAPHADLPPYATPGELLAELRTIDASLATHGAAPLAAGRLAPLLRAVEVFGFHLAVLDLRQNADVHEAVIAELLARAGVTHDYAALPEPERIALLDAELASPRLLHSPHLAYSDLRALRARGARRRCRHPSPLRAGRTAELCDLEVPVGLRPARSRDPAQGGRPVARRRARRQHRAAVRDHRRPRPLGGDHARRLFAAALPPLARRTARMAGGDARLLGQQQGRRLPDRQLGALPGRARAGRRVSPTTASGCGSFTAAAARSGAAAARASRRSSRSRPAASPAACASPSRARSSPASTPIPSSAGATWRRSSRRRSRRA